MAERQRPTYSGVPARAEAEVSDRRQRADDVQAAAPPPPAPASSPIPMTIEQRLKAMERQMALLVSRVELIIDILGPGNSADADVPGRAPVRKK